MNQNLKNHVDDLFQHAPKTRATYELKEEVLSNANDRYADLIKDQIPEAEALDIVIHSIGNVEDLFTQTEEQGATLNHLDDTLRKKIALYKSVAIGMYIFAFIIMVALDDIYPHLNTLGFVLMLAIAAVATSILVYVGTAYPKYNRQADTIVEEFKEWNHNQEKTKAIKSSLNMILWMVVLVLYFMISFLTYAWYITWVIFLIGACAQAILNLVFHLKDHS